MSEKVTISKERFAELIEKEEMLDFFKKMNKDLIEFLNKK